MFSLDKFAAQEDFAEEQIYVIDGEYYGGPTRFINHSCEPNCRQYVVSMNKNDPLIYETAFFAIRDIAVGEELVFDYLDKDEQEEEDSEQAADDETLTEDSIRCLCGAKKCRKWLWI
jgi:[histone H3]-lysine9 N-trimethyltransferase SUV39H